jgi:hypothetical protein
MFWDTVLERRKLSLTSECSPCRSLRSRVAVLGHAGGQFAQTARGSSVSGMSAAPICPVGRAVLLLAWTAFFKRRIIAYNIDGHCESALPNARRTAVLVVGTASSDSRSFGPLYRASLLKLVG